MIYILDTDHLSILDQNSVESGRLTARLAEGAPNTFFVSIITYEEQMRGWLSYLAQAATVERQVPAYRKLRRHVDRYRAVPLLDFDERAAAEYGRLSDARIRIGTMDLKIAAIALANDATLLTRNTGHFERVPGLHFEDWAD
jgi:tRNA(fMet)-specific endonuclease VapC